MNEERLNKVAIKYCELQGIKNPDKALFNDIKIKIGQHLRIDEAIRLVEIDENQRKQTFAITGTLSDKHTFTIGGVGMGHTQLNGMVSAQPIVSEGQAGKEVVHRFFD